MNDQRLIRKNLESIEIAFRSAIEALIEKLRTEAVIIKFISGGILFTRCYRGDFGELGNSTDDIIRRVSENFSKEDGVNITGADSFLIRAGTSSFARYKNGQLTIYPPYVKSWEAEKMEQVEKEV